MKNIFTLFCVFMCLEWTESKIRYLPKTVPALSQANNEFAFSLHKTLSKEGNVLFSPWSVAFSLGMIMLGAEGKTLHEMKSTMFLDQVDTDNIHYGFKQLREHLVRYDNEYEMSMFSTILVQQRLNVSPVYKLKLQRYYDADIQDVDFADHGQLVVDWINVWTSLKTSGKIQQVMTSLPSPDTVMLLLTANYFKGKWEETFSRNETKQAQFHNADGSTSDVDMMFATRNMSIYDGEDFALEAVHLSMKGDVSFLFMKPENPGEMAELEKNISSKFFEQLFNDFSEGPVELGLPKFKASSRMELEKPLQELGMKSLFSNFAQLTGISSSGGLSVQEVVHKAALEIDEEGAVAASITVTSIASRHKVYKLHFNSPFLFVIRDVKSGVILFMGRIEKL